MPAISSRAARRAEALPQPSTTRRPGYQVAASSTQWDSTDLGATINVRHGPAFSSATSVVGVFPVPGAYPKMHLRWERRKSTAANWYGRSSTTTAPRDMPALAPVVPVPSRSGWRSRAVVWLRRAPSLDAFRSGAFGWPVAAVSQRGADG